MMRSPTSLGVLTSILVLAAAPAPAFAQAPQAPQVPARHLPPKASERARLDEAFKSVEAELKAALEDYQQQLEVARMKQIPNDQLPPLPTPDFYDRLDELAKQNQLDALRWCLGAISVLNLPYVETNARKEDYYDRIIHAYPTSPVMLDIVVFLRDEATPIGIGLEKTIKFLDHLVEHTTISEVRLNALAAKADLYQKSTAPEDKEKYDKVLNEIVAKFPASPEAKRARGFFFEREHLQVGKPAPDFTTQDVDGVSFKLSDYLGKVVVIDFWGFWCRSCIDPKVLNAKKEMVARLANEPFALIGIATDTGKDSFKRLCEEKGLTWRHSWQGEKMGPLCVEWGIARFPTIYVLDAKGVIRYKNVKHEDLVAAVDTLMAEMKESKQAPPGTGGGR